MGFSRILTRLIDLLYRKVGKYPFTLRAFLLYGAVAGTAAVLIDFDHLFNYLYIWANYKPESNFITRPLHLPLLIISLALVGYYCARLGRLLNR